jgi:lysophospholipase L1-like esterase
MSLSTLRSAAITIAITLALDFVVTLFIPAATLDSWVAARDRDAQIYDRTVAWHHDIRPNLDTTRLWGQDRYAFRSDRHGFRTGRCAAAGTPEEKDKAVLIVGDSFAEGLGLPFENAFAGLLACALRERGLVASNLGTMGYSPVIYHRKIAEAVRRLGYPPREIVLFLDISDIHNDAVDYVEIAGRVHSERPTLARRAKDFLKHNFTSFAVIFEINQRYLVTHATPMTVLNNKLSRWTVDKDLFAAWGERGLATVAANLEKVVAQCRSWNCRLTLVVYPWPDQVAAQDRDSIQVRYWRDWSARHDVRFVDAFAPFFALPADETIKRYFIRGDVHFNTEGSRLVFDAVWRAISAAR